MDARPEIDIDKYNTFLPVSESTQEPDEPKDPPASFCSIKCRNSYREERMNGLPLPRHNMSGKDVSHKSMCATLSLCAYCENKMEK